MAAEFPVPAHLKQFVVQQDYGAYTAQDQAIWRFVLLQTHARLLHTAHPAYASGFEAAGIEVDRIPNIAQVSDRLASSSFRAVCVDGFIPPRAFQAFQARGVLPIAADIRTSTHLTYTPAPDIIHEAAGHAPFLAEADYARYLRRIGSVSEHAFESPHDRKLYAAIHLLSEVKEDPASTPDQVARAEALLASTRAESAEVSEATRMARLYWWTVEYGLVGTPSDFRLYGAGLLSSIGEAHFCHAVDVIKRPLDASCVEVDYDITRSQPQLFVVPEFAALEQVLDDVASSLSHQRGGVAALTEARRSGDVASVTLDSGLQLMGVVHDWDADHVELSGPCRVARDNDVLSELPATLGYWLPLGTLTDGTPLSRLTVDALHRHAPAGQLQLLLASGVVVSGKLAEVVAEAGRVHVLVLHGCAIARRDDPVFQTSAPYPLVLAQSVATASALIANGYYPATAMSQLRVPKPRTATEAEQILIALHDEVSAHLRDRLGGQAVARFREMHRTLTAHFPDEWLLRWNLLEALVRLGAAQDATSRSLTRELEQLEIRYQHREPIATGLAYLRAITGVDAASAR
jgi:phenylalanine-4-hydroxylase